MGFKPWSLVLAYSVNLLGQEQYLVKNCMNNASHINVVEGIKAQYLILNWQITGVC